MLACGCAATANVFLGLLQALLPPHLVQGVPTAVARRLVESVLVAWFV